MEEEMGTLIFTNQNQNNECESVEISVLPFLAENCEKPVEF